MFKGIIESESLNDTSILQEIKIIEEHEEYHAEAETKNWHICKVEVSDDEIKEITKRISKTIKYRWYSIFWDKKYVYVIFSNKIFKIPREKEWKSDRYKKVREYGLKHGIQEEYLNFDIRD